MKSTRSSRAQWREFFSNFSYKPNWVFDITEPIYDMDGLVLKVTMKVPDSRTPRRLPETWPVDGTRTQIPLVPISQTIILDPWINEVVAKYYILSIIRKMEDHEIGEWFRYKGELPFDPHKEN